MNCLNDASGRIAWVLFGFVLIAGGGLLQAGEVTRAHEAGGTQADLMLGDEPTTTSSADIPLDELALLVKPLSADELQVEATAWMALLKAKTLEVSQAEIAVKQKNKTIQKAEEVQESIEDTQDLLDEVESASEEARDQGGADAAAQASELAEEASEAAAETAQTIDDAVDTAEEVARSEQVQEALDASARKNAEDLSESAHEAVEATQAVSRSAEQTAAAAERGQEAVAARLAGETLSAVGEAQGALADTSEVLADAVDDSEAADKAAESSIQLDKTAEAVEALADSEMEDKIDILDSVTALRAQRTGLIDRLNVVLDDLATKLPPGKEDAENDIIVPYRLYAASVGGIQVDIADTQALRSSLSGWLRSEVGGIRLARNLGIFAATVLAFWVLGSILGRLVDKAMQMSRSTALLMREFVVQSVRRGCVLIGVVIGLTALQVNIGPILAMIGAAGFVIAFALQNTLSNFASGMMIMLYRPFDVGDWIEVAGVNGVAKSMNLVTTTIATLDNQIMIVPNNSIWGNTIINITGSEMRRVDLIVGISYNDDISEAERLMLEILHAHPLVLDEPKPVIGVQELAEYSVNFVCRPWTRTENYWQVYWDITRSVKERFEQAGLETPYPHQNLHHRSEGS